MKLGLGSIDCRLLSLALFKGWLIWLLALQIVSGYYLWLNLKTMG
jgi:hypothetical protein